MPQNPGSSSTAKWYSRSNDEPDKPPPNDAGQIAGQVKAHGKHQSARKIARKSAANATAERAPNDEHKIWGDQGVNGARNKDIKSSPLVMPILPPNVVP